MASSLVKQIFCNCKFKHIARLQYCPTRLIGQTRTCRGTKHVNKAVLFQNVFPRAKLWFKPYLAKAGGLGFSFAFIGATVHCLSSDQDEAHQRFLLAIRRRENHLLDQYINQGGDVNRRHPLGWTALHVATINRNIEAVKKLLAAGADPNVGDEFSTVSQVSREKQQHGLHENELIKKERILSVHYARQDEFSDRLSAGANFKNCTALHYAALADDEEIVKLLLDAGADPTLENSYGYKPVEYAKTASLKQRLTDSESKFLEVKANQQADERRRFPLEQRLKEQLVGQEGAINLVASAIRRKENGWYDEDHPLVFLFLGSSGIGKTELAKQVAKYLHKDSKKAFIRLDMSEYQEKHEVAKFIGSPPGYVGHDEGGQLTKKLKECPKAVVLFDEVDKAHPDVLTIMLQLFDEGRLTDGKGKTIECKDALFIMTSNLASDEIGMHGLQLRREAEELSKMKKSGKFDEIQQEEEQITISRRFKDQVVRPILKRHFRRDEFLGRINEIVYFLPFSRSEMNKLVIRELDFWAKRAQEKHEMQVLWDHQVVDALADGYDVHYGARSIKYEVERRVVSQLAMAHERQLIEKGCVLKLSVSNAEKLKKRGKEDEEEEEEEVIPVIKLQMLKKGRLRDEYVDLNLSGNENPFATGL